MQNFFRIVSCFCFIFLSGNYLFSQTTKFFSTEQGLSNSLINQIYQDRKGFIWIATENGLNKFDGNKFVVYRKIKGDSTSLKNNYVQTVFEDQSGNFWIGCIDGLMKYDRNTNLFHEVEICNENGIRLYPHFKSIFERRNGDIWFASSGEGLFSVKKGETKCKPEIQLNERLCSRFLTVVHEDSRSRLWIGSENDGLNVYSFKTDEMLIYTAATSDASKRLSSNDISAICEDESGTVFVGALSGEISKFELPEMKITVIRGSDKNNDLSVKTLILDDAKRLLVGIDGSGMKRYNSQKQKLETYEPFSAPFDFSKAKVHSLLRDNVGNLWVGIFQKGVFFIPANSNEFKYYGYKSFRENSIGSNCIMAIHKDEEGIIWIGTDNDGLYALNERTQEIRHFENTSDPFSVPNTIICIRESRDGYLWLGSFLNGLALFDKKTGKCNYVNKINNAISSKKVYSIVDDKKGNLWIGSNGGGLYKFDYASQTLIEHYFQYKESDKGLANNWINSLLYEEEGLLWIGTFKGLSCLDTNTNTFQTYRQENSDLPGNIIFSMKKDKLGKIWIGANEGLARLNKKTQTIKSFTVEDGLANNVICSIEDDEDGNIWMSTLSGISQYSQENNDFTNYYASDGLQGNEFTRGASFKSADGELFFGGINGITSFFPNQIHSTRRNINVYITDFYLSGKPIFPGQKSGNKEILDCSILDASQIKLASQDNVFSFEFSTLEYANSETVSYRYFLENFNVDWVNTPLGTNRITYTNLNPGKYNLLFQAIDKENKSEIKTIEIIIRPPWYKTLIAKGFYLILALLLLCGIYVFISMQIRQRDEVLRLEQADRINEAKLQFFTNISHEIRTPMTLIIGPLEKLLMKNSNSELQNAYLLIYRNAQRILRLINQLMDIRKIDQGQMHLKSRETDIVGFIKDVMQSFEYMAQKKKIDFEFNPGIETLKVWVDLNNFDKVLFNVFSNAFKYTPEQGKITVELTTGNDDSQEGPLNNYFEIRVLDTGFGIDKEKINKIFERFYQIDSEVTNSNFGTGIGLHLSRSLVELQQGIIYAENRTDRSGSCFVIRMPLGNSHLKRDEMEVISEQTPLATFVYSKKDDLFDMETDPEEESSTVSARTKYRVLVVEDDMEINNYIKAELASLYKISQISNGKDALEYILKETPDLVISDILMPKMDGIMLCRKIKSNVNIDHIPVILLTAKSKEEDLAEGLDRGADAYIVKPFNPEILKKTVANILANRERLKGKAQSQSGNRMQKIELKSYDEILMEKIMKIINDNIKDPKLNVEMLSAGVGMSRVHMHRKLKELTNLAPRDFIRTIRLKQAGELLANKKLNVSQVYNAVGFTTFSHFSSSFKEFYGVSPKEYMNGYTSARSKKRIKKE